LEPGTILLLSWHKILEKSILARISNTFSTVYSSFIIVAVRPLQLQVQNQQAVMQDSNDTIECKASIEPNITHGYHWYNKLLYTSARFSSML